MLSGACRQNSPLFLRRADLAYQPNAVIGAKEPGFGDDVKGYRLRQWESGVTTLAIPTMV